MTQTINNKPVQTLRDGALKASIWRNLNRDGAPFYSVTLSRSYKKPDGVWAESNSFTGAELFKIARLAQEAYSHALNLRDLGEDIYLGADAGQQRTQAAP